MQPTPTQLAVAGLGRSLARWLATCAPSPIHLSSSPPPHTTTHLPATDRQALIYAARWPDPLPQVFGYHECFHVAVTLAALLHFAAVWRIVNSPLGAGPPGGGGAFKAA